MVHELPHGLLRRITRSRCRGYSEIEPFVIGKRGLEIGGPSPMFHANKLIPVYDRCASIDDCNFSSQTIWSSNSDLETFGARFGKQFVSEACDLSQIPNGEYDFLLASHVLEHVANPLRALGEWSRVVVPGGALLVLVPDKRNSFDHRRPYTSFSHIASDFQKCTSEDDLEHVEEVVKLHDLGLDPEAGSPAQFRDRCLRNSSVRAVHHHVFSPEVLIEMFSFLKLFVISISIERPYHIIVLARRADSLDHENVRKHNQGFLSKDADWRRNDPLVKRSNSLAGD